MRYDEASRDAPKDRDREKDQRVREKEARSRDRSSPSANGEDVPLKNGCCRPCMKAFSETKRACLCQVPVDVRMGHLPEAGCKVYTSTQSHLYINNISYTFNRCVGVMDAIRKKRV